MEDTPMTKACAHASTSSFDPAGPEPGDPQADPAAAALGAEGPPVQGGEGLPTGLTRLARVEDLLRDRQGDAEWGLTLPRWGLDPRWRLLTPTDAAVGNALVDGTPRAVGRTANDRLVWIPAAAWLTDTPEYPSLLWCVIAAKQPITIKGFGGADFEVKPLIALHDLAMIFRAARPPAPLPDSVRALILDPEAEAPVKAEALAPVKPRPVSPAELLRWWLDYLKEHPDPERRPTAAEQHAAAKAHFVGCIPPSSDAMQELRRHPLTPPEWREPGRRTKS